MDIKSVKKYLINNKKKFLWMLILSLVIIIIATALDFYVHTLEDEYAVPSYYFTNKIIYGGLFTFITLIVFRKLSGANKSFLVGIIVSLLLEVKYATQEYTLSFLIIFICVHFAAISIPAWILLSRFDKYVK